MSLNAYLTLVGQTQGAILGSVTQTGYVNSILVLETDYEVGSTRDSSSGLPTGKIEQTTFTITKEVDRSSPELYRALFNNETMTTFQLKFLALQANGTAINYYTIQLTGAQIVNIQFQKPNNLDPTLGSYPEMEIVSFTYQQIQIRYTSGNLTTVGNWGTPIM